ncbi:MAG: hypothetical protein O2960_10890 [Verrucomicrobia bacterium]|nr:hypothetical protein [Verrucomicrobiota bacterium]
MTAVFSSRFKADLLVGEANYARISARLASGFRERVAGQSREITKWNGGDHIGSHGFPCCRTRPFPFYVYYAFEGGTIYFLGLVHELRHPEFLKNRIQKEGGDVRNP